MTTVKLEIVVYFAVSNSSPKDFQVFEHGVLGNGWKVILKIKPVSYIYISFLYVG